MSALVLRFSSLGDIVLAGSVTAQLAPVVFVTGHRFAQVAAALQGVVAVVALEKGESLGHLAARIRGVLAQTTGFQESFHRVDLHASLRSRALALRLGGTWRRVARFDLRRRCRVAFKVAPAPSVVRRYATSAGVEVAEPPWIGTSGPKDAILLVPGAAWHTKTWPLERYLDLVPRLEGPLVILGGPGEEELCERVGRASGSRADVLCMAGFQEVLHVLGRGRLVIGGDTGLTHLAAATGMPALVVFGATCMRDGFWSAPYRVRGVERTLPCRPCSRFGGKVCPMGDLLCLWDIGSEEVARMAAELLEACP